MTKISNSFTNYPIAAGKSTTGQGAGKTNTIWTFWTPPDTNNPQTVLSTNAPLNMTTINLTDSLVSPVNTLTELYDFTREFPNLTTVILTGNPVAINGLAWQNLTKLTLLWAKKCGLTLLPPILPTFLSNIDVSSNELPVSEVNRILAILNANGVGGGTLLINNQTPPAAPTDTTDLNALLAKGWTINHD